MVTTEVWSKQKSDGSRTGYTLREEAPALLHAVGANNHERILKLLRGSSFTKATDVNTQDGRGKTALHIAALMDAADTTSILLAHGAEVNAKDENGQKTPLHIAADAESNAVLQILLTHGAEVNAKDETGETPLHIAASDKSGVIPQILLSHGAEVNAKDETGQTPLHTAAQNWGSGDTGYKMKSSAVPQILLSHGAEVNAKDERGDTPLHKLMREKPNDHKIQKILLLYGAEVNAKNRDGKTPGQCSGDSEKLPLAAP